jgi:hypothetical protein
VLFLVIPGTLFMPGASVIRRSPVIAHALVSRLFLVIPSEARDLGVGEAEIPRLRLGMTIGWCSE